MDCRRVSFEEAGLPHLSGAGAATGQEFSASMREGPHAFTLHLSDSICTCVKWKCQYTSGFCKLSDYIIALSTMPGT